MRVPGHRPSKVTSGIILTGKVIKGFAQAKDLGFPTFNISHRLAPKTLKQGVYAARVKTSAQSAGNFLGVAYFGPRFAPGADAFSASHGRANLRSGRASPRVAPRSHRVFEVHCFGVPKMPHVKRLTMELVKLLRSPKKFTGAAALKKQIAHDIAQAKKILKNTIILHGQVP